MPPTHQHHFGEVDAIRAQLSHFNNNGDIDIFSQRRLGEISALEVSVNHVLDAFHKPTILDVVDGQRN